MFTQKQLPLIRSLVQQLRSGWDNKKIFQNKEGHDPSLSPSEESNPGWELLLQTLDRLFNRNGIAWGNHGPSPASVYRTLIELEGFMSIVGEPGTEQSSETDLYRGKFEGELITHLRSEGFDDPEDVTTTVIYFLTDRKLISFKYE